MRIAIMGSGGVVRYADAWLQQTGEQVHFIARGAHLAALQQQGLPGLTAPFSDDARQTAWEKFVTRASLLRTRLGSILAHPETRALQRQLIDETPGVLRDLVLHEQGRSA